MIDYKEPPHKLSLKRKIYKNNKKEKTNNHPQNKKKKKEEITAPESEIITIQHANVIYIYALRNRNNISNTITHRSIHPSII